MRTGFSVYTRYCKKCHRYYKTIFKNGKVCPDCMDNRGAARTALIIISEMTKPKPKTEMEKVMEVLLEDEQIDDDENDDPGLF